MEYRPLGRITLRVSTIGLGCVTFGREIDEQASFAILDHAFKQGITLIDAAEAYGKGLSEAIVGRWMARRGVRDLIVLATNVGGSLTRERVLASAEASLRRLQTDAIDLYLLHRWDPDVPLEETLDALDRFVAAGKVRAVGCSNYTAAQLQQALTRHDPGAAARIQAAEQGYNLALREIEGAMLPLCAAEQVSVLAYSPLGGGFLTGKYRVRHTVPPGTRFDIVPAHQEMYFTASGFEALEQLRTEAEARALPMPLLALAWVIRRPGLASVLVGARNVAQVDQAFAAEQVDQAPHLS